ALDKCQPGAAVLIQRLGRDPVSEDGTGGVELLTAEQPAAIALHQACLDIQRVLAVTFGATVADAPAGQHAGEQALLLSWRGCGSKQADQAEMVLRDLSQRRIHCRDDAEHLSNGGEGQLRTAEFERYGDAAQPAAGELLHQTPGQAALTV